MLSIATAGSLATPAVPALPSVVSYNRHLSPSAQAHSIQQIRRRLGTAIFLRCKRDQRALSGQVVRAVGAAMSGARTAHSATLQSLPVLSQLSSGKLPSAASPLLLGTCSRILDHYWERCPTAVKVMELLGNEQQQSQSPVFFDHFAFRTFGVEGLGISSLADGLMDLGYTEQPDRLVFETKKLQARWYAPPDIGSSLDFPLPRIFVSELEVEKLSERAQAIIHKYTSAEVGWGSRVLL